MNKSEILTSKSSNRIVGYERVSTQIKKASGEFLQKFDRQLVGVELDAVFIERASAKNITGRPELQECIKFLKSGDTLVVHEISRLARSVDDLYTIVNDLLKRKVSVKFMKEGLDFSAGERNPIGKLMLSVIGAMVEFEREIKAEHISEGIQAKIARGEKWGGHYKKAAEKLEAFNDERAAKKKELEAPHVKVVSDLASKGLTMAAIAARMTEYGMLSVTGREYNSGSISRLIKRYEIAYSTDRRKAG